MQQLITYDNTPSNAITVGWAAAPEYCMGNVSTASKVTHDHDKGVFVFHDETTDETPSINVLLQAYRL